jgi:hypothetical protein
MIAAIRGVSCKGRRFHRIDHGVDAYLLQLHLDNLSHPDKGNDRRCNLYRFTIV